ncbi:MAG: polysaccharide pyruvyl transferase family protein [Stenomitos frigidus ULC029]
MRYQEDTFRSIQMQICLLDPSLQKHDGTPSDNLGDLIIHAAVRRELSSLFGEREILRISTHTPMATEQVKLASHSSLIFVGGTNLLSSKMNEYRQWKIWMRQSIYIRRAILLGVGWWQYQEAPDLYTRLILHTALSKRGALHSVRDEYTRNKLELIGIRNVINTGCPTMWPLADLAPGDVPTQKAKQALVMLTDYLKEPELDRKLLELLLAKYEKVFFWPQGKGDADYVASLNLDLPMIWLDRSLESLENFVDTAGAFDYIGTRLHGGVRCLLSKKRSLILEVDNRAKEIAADTGLPTVKRDDFASLEHWIDNPSVTKISIDLANVEQWRNQFKPKVKDLSVRRYKLSKAS